MKLEELKKIIKDCIKEVLFEEKGVLSHIVKECLSTSPQRDIKSTFIEEKRQVNEDKQFDTRTYLKNSLPSQEKEKIKEAKKRLLEVVGKEAYNGVNIFEGTKPLTSGGNISNEITPQSSLANVDPNDPGIPIDQIFGDMSQIWGKIAAGKKKK